jgi:hypothetical protein
MARISNYDLDGTINNSDKLIGTDSSDGTTKNFNIQSVKEFVYAGISGNMTVASNGTATASSAATLTTARNIGGVSFDGSGNITLPGVDSTGNQDTSGNAATATKLASPATIGGVSFDGSNNINLPGVNTSGNQNTSGTAAIATTITVADESSDTTCFPVFVTNDSGNLAPKTGSNLAFNSSSGALTASNFVTTSDKRLKSEIQPIKEGLKIIKQFTSYSYIKGGEKESGFIAQEVKEVIPHAVYENNDGYLSMSDRSVLAHMHKAILELEEKLVAIEEKLK